MIVPVVLSGGSGTRLWPLSRPEQPKQLLAMIDERTMLRATIDRLAGIPEVADPVVVCNAGHGHLVASELDAAGFATDRVILEPEGRNTAPAVAAAATFLLEAAEDAILLVLPADHIIRDEGAFRDAVTIGAVQARGDRLVTFGIVPDYPETGYGYIRVGEPVDPPVSRIAEFVEKPDLAAAEEYLADGGYLWNSGMFVFGARRYLTELERFQPAIVKATTAAVAAANRDGALALDRAAFVESPSDSIDLAVMERTDGGVVVPLDAGWSDVGSWAALWDVAPRDAHGNVVVGDVRTVDTSGSYLRTESRLLAAIGLSDMVVVETADAVLVAPRDRAQDVKQIVDGLRGAARVEASRHLRRPTGFGTIEDLESSASSLVRRLTIAAGGETITRSRSGGPVHWIVTAGRGTAAVGDDSIDIRAGDAVAIATGVPHHLESTGSSPLEVVEIQIVGETADDTTVDIRKGDG